MSQETHSVTYHHFIFQGLPLFSEDKPPELKDPSSPIWNMQTLMKKVKRFLSVADRDFQNISDNTQIFEGLLMDHHFSILQGFSFIKK